LFIKKLKLLAVPVFGVFSILCFFSEMVIIYCLFFFFMITGYHRVSPGITGYHRVSPGITGYHSTRLFFAWRACGAPTDVAGGAGHA
jgi:hypothetical protein